MNVCVTYVHRHYFIIDFDICYADFNFHKFSFVQVLINSMFIFVLFSWNILVGKSIIGWKNTKTKKL